MWADGALGEIRRAVRMEADAEQQWAGREMDEMSS